MRLLITILFLSAFAANATTYYVSNAGNDANDGFSTATPWRTIAKVNSFLFVPGDKILFNSGDTWNERLIIASSGTSASPITISYYGAGNQPLITGFQTLTGLTNSGNIWTVTASNAANNLNTVLVDGALRAKGRYPNTGYIGQTSSTPTQLNNTGLSGDYTGAEVAARVVRWVTDLSKVTSQSGATLNVSPPFNYTPLGGFGFFLQNLPSFNDVNYEWSFNNTTKVFSIYSTTTPTVQISTLDTLITIKGNYVTVDGLNITGADDDAVRFDNTKGTVIKNCYFNFSGQTAIEGWSVPDCKVLTNTVLNSLSNGIYISSGSRSLIDGNYVKNSGNLSGMGLGGEAKYVGIYCGAQDTLSIISNNRVDSSGSVAIFYFAYNGLVYHNVVNTFCYIKDDLGGIYFGWDGQTEIRGNIVYNGIGALSGATGAAIAPGIYADIGQQNLIVDSNTVFNCNWSQIFLYGASHVRVQDNIAISIPTYPAFWTNYSSSYLTSQRNIFYSAYSNSLAFQHYATSATDTINNNYYLRPVSETNKLASGGTTYNNLSAWATATGYDKNSNETPAGLTTDAPLFYFNPTQRDSSIQLTGSFYDPKINGYRNSITLKPFTSTLLFKSAKDFLIITGSTKRKLYKRMVSL